MMGSVLVTGASGFVGLNVLECLLAQGRTVVGLSAGPVAAAVAGLAARRFARLPGRPVEVQGDVRDRVLLDELMQRHDVGHVVHLAAITAGPLREREAAEQIISVNLEGLATVLAAAARRRVRRFVYTSSVAVYGGQPADGSLIDEDTPHSPQTLYAITKSAGEAVAQRLGALHGIDVVVARLGRVYGPFEHDTGVRDTLSQIHQVTQAAIAGRAVAFERPCVKNWCYAPDTAVRLGALLQAPPLQHRVYNLGSSYAWPLSAWCERLVERFPGFSYHVGTPLAADALPIDLGGARDSGLLSWQRCADELNPAPETPFDGAFEATLNAL